MKFLVKICLSSMRARILTVSLVIIALSVSGFLLLGVDRIHRAAKNNFENTISQTDLIVGARSGPLNLLLYAVFRIGNPTNNISWETYEDFKSNEKIAWTVPISLGDSFRGYRVVGTTPEYYKYYRFGSKRNLSLYQGKWFQDSYEVVLGSAVASSLGLKLGEKIVISHGIGEVVFEKHDKHPFKIVGILDPTGTPVDQSVHISLESITAIHLGWEPNVDPENLKPEDISAFLLGIKRKREIFQVQREVNEYPEEALTAIMPGVAFMDLWKIVRVFEAALTVTGLAVVLSSILGMLATLITGLSSRSREFAILRSVGAGPLSVLILTLLEILIISLTACVIAFSLLAISSPILQAVAERKFNFILQFELISLDDIKWIVGIIGASLLVGIIPATMAARSSLNQELRIRL